MQKWLEAESERLALTDPSPDGGQALARYREFLQLGHGHALARHRAGAGGLEVCCHLSLTIDVLLRSLVARVLARREAEVGPLKTPFAILALGGYGREELCPFSDIDLMFLYPDRARGAEFAAEQAYLNDSLLYPLWDLGLKVGHGTRTPKDAITEARAEVQSKNAMLEARVLCGDPSLAKRFNRQFQRFIRKENARLYIEERLEDQI